MKRKIKKIKFTIPEISYEELRNKEIKKVPRNPVKQFQKTKSRKNKNEK